MATVTITIIDDGEPGADHLRLTVQFDPVLEIEKLTFAQHVALQLISAAQLMGNVDQVRTLTDEDLS